MIKNGLFTSESVTEGHPDKMCDQFSDAILDEVMRRDPNLDEARVACECGTKNNVVFVIGEITMSTPELFRDLDIPSIVRKTANEIGYSGGGIHGFDADTCDVEIIISRQTEGIKKGANDEDAGAGDQGMMFGYACNETTPEHMPAPIYLAHEMTKRLTDVRRDNTIPYLGPDGKSQVTFEYDGDGNPVRVHTVLISAHHSTEMNSDEGQKKMFEDIKKEVILPMIPAKWQNNDLNILINPTGKFDVGGPFGDAGLTGRKIIVDTYGGYSRHGGGAFSGKDPTKVDRSAAYAARYLAKNVVAAGIADKCEIQIAYAIGKRLPVSVYVDTFRTGKISDADLSNLLREMFDLSPAGIIQRFDLRRPIYKKTAAYGHVGREYCPKDKYFPWENLDLVEVLLAHDLAKGLRM